MLSTVCTRTRRLCPVGIPVQRAIACGPDLSRDKGNPASMSRLRPGTQRDIHVSLAIGTATAAERHHGDATAAGPDSQACAHSPRVSRSGVESRGGLVLGQRVFGCRGTLLGIGIDEPASALTSQVAALASDASTALGPRIAFDVADVNIDDRYCGPGYGVLTDLEREAIRVFARTEGILLDPVYTGRAAGGLLDLIRRGFFPRDARILFWHTGGQPALFAEPYRNALV
jgi:hypothetical protein